MRIFGGRDRQVRGAGSDERTAGSTAPNNPAGGPQQARRITQPARLQVHVHPAPPPIFGERGLARVWLGPEPGDGSHSHIIGVLTATAWGVAVPAGSFFRPYVEGEWARFPREEGHYSEWEQDTTIPWHRVYAIDWLPHDTDLSLLLQGRGG